MDQTLAVQQRYAAAANAVEPALCCPVTYDSRFLAAIPEAVIERDCGCGDPNRFVRPRETVLDLGSGGGKICFIARQVVGAEGRVTWANGANDTGKPVASLVACGAMPERSALRWAAVAGLVGSLAGRHPVGVGYDPADRRPRCLRRFQAALEVAVCVDAHGRISGRGAR